MPAGEEFQLQGGDKLHVGVAMDGSALSEKALRAGCSVHLKHQTLSLATDFLGRQQAHMEPEFVSREKAPAQSTCQTLTALAADAHVNLLVVGSYGRKGEKIDMLGSVSDYSLREAPASVWVVRSTTPATDGQVYLFGTDGSATAAQAFTRLVHLIARPGKDTVIVAKVGSAPPPPDLFHPYQAVLASQQVAGECLHASVAPTQTVAQGVLALAGVKGATCIVMGIAGWSHEKLGSVSEEVCTHATCNTLILKDAHEVNHDEVSKGGARSIQAQVARTARDETGRLSRQSLDPPGSKGRAAGEGRGLSRASMELGGICAGRHWPM